MGRDYRLFALAGLPLNLRCTAPGVQSYAGYVDLAEDKHSFFYFFAARNNVSKANDRLNMTSDA